MIANLGEAFRRGVSAGRPCPQNRHYRTAAVAFSQFNSLRRMLASDLTANAGGKGPRAMLWAWLLNPGFSTIGLHRVAQYLVSSGFRRLGAFLWACNVRRAGCHFNPDALIGAGLSLPHPVGIVIGSGCEIGENVCLYQSVTIGRNRSGGYPVIATGAILLPGAIVIGGVRVGAGALIGATALVQADVPDHATLIVAQTQTIRTREPPSPPTDDLKSRNFG